MKLASIKNFGQTPAYNVKFWTAFRIDVFPPPKNAYEKPVDPITVAVDTLAPQAQDFPKNAVTLPYKPGATQAIEMKAGAFYVFGRIDYEDIFHRKCWTTYRRYAGGDAGFFENKMAVTEQGNDADRHCDSWFDW